jgi:hypothetical protein
MGFKETKTRDADDYFFDESYSADSFLMSAKPMLNKIIVIRLCNSRDSSVEPFDMKIQLDDNSAVDLWYQRFKYELKSEAFFRKEHVFMGESTLTTEEMIGRVNTTLDHISKFDFVAEQWSRWHDFVAADQTNVIDHPISENPDISVRLTMEDFAGGNDNKKMNIVHNYFPLLSGPALKTAAYMYIATDSIKASIMRLNLEVHELHTTLQNESDAPEDFNMHLNISWQRAPKHLPSLPDCFNELFTPYNKFGDVLLGFPQVGKTHIEAYSEEDEELEDEHIEPIKFLAGDMLIKLSTDMDDNWVDGFHAWLVEQGLDPNDPAGRYGFAKLGRVVDCDLEYVRNSISGKYDDIDKITITDPLAGDEEYHYPYSRFDDNYKEKFLEYLND